MTEFHWSIALLVSGIGCALLAAMVLGTGIRHRTPEMAILGGALSLPSLGMAAQGVALLLHDGDISTTTLRLALPAGLLVAAPIVGARSRWSGAVMQRWELWTTVTIGVGIVLATTPVFAPTLTLPSIPMLVLAGLALVGGLAVARRQWYLHRISGRPSSAVAAGSLVVYALAVTIGPWLAPASPGAWLVLGIDIVALAGATIGIVVGQRLGNDVHRVLAPVVSREPLAALEVGLAPEVRAFVAALATKDDVTRDHVVRTSALAIRVAMRAGLPAATVRDVALAGLLHDVGKLVVPGEILRKDGPLTDDEFDVVRTHSEVGDDLLRRIPPLTGVAPLVRAHHEQVDGRGYPDGLHGDDITVEMGIVSVTDAWDAMTQDRPYRSGMDPHRAAAIVTDGAGTQWRADAVRLLLREVAIEPRVELTAFEAIDDVDRLAASCTCGSEPQARINRAGAMRPTRA